MYYIHFISRFIQALYYNVLYIVFYSTLIFCTNYFLTCFTNLNNSGCANMLVQSSNLSVNIDDVLYLSHTANILLISYNIIIVVFGIVGES